LTSIKSIQKDTNKESNFNNNDLEDFISKIRHGKSELSNNSDNSSQESLGDKDNDIDADNITPYIIQNININPSTNPTTSNNYSKSKKKNIINYSNPNNISFSNKLEPSKGLKEELLHKQKISHSHKENKPGKIKLSVTFEDDIKNLYNGPKKVTELINNNEEVDNLQAANSKSYPKDIFRKLNANIRKRHSYSENPINPYLSPIIKHINQQVPLSPFSTTMSPTKASKFKNITSMNVNFATQKITKEYLGFDDDFVLDKSGGSVLSEIKCNCKSILLVDDENMNIRSLQNMLKQKNLEGDFAQDGVECVNKVENQIKENCNCGIKYKLIFMDFMMPNMNGLEASKKIQELCSNKIIKGPMHIIMVSAHGSNEMMEKIKNYPIIKKFIQKPARKSAIENVLNDFYFSK